MKKLELYLQKHAAIVKTILMAAALLTLVLSVVAFAPKNDPHWNAERSDLYRIEGQTNAAIEAIELKPAAPTPTLPPGGTMPQAHSRPHLPGPLEQERIMKEWDAAGRP